jgi:glycosyltransferase involved in cell wall biosynthesis
MGKKSHIVFIVENATVPVDLRVWRQARTAREAGYMVSVIAPKARIYRKSYEVIDGIHIYRYPNVTIGDHQAGLLLEYANAILWELIFCGRLYLKRPFQLVHVANPPDLLFIVGLFVQALGAKFVYDSHDLSPELYLTKFKGKKNAIYFTLKILEKMSCKVADVIITTNHSQKKILADRNSIGPERFFVVRNDPEVRQIFRGRTRTKTSQEMTELLYLGSINIQDGVDILMRILDILVNRDGIKNFRCSIVGDGDALQEVERLAGELKIKEYCHFPGYICDQKVVEEYLKAADICIESAPDNVVNRCSTFIKVMEYMAAAKPIVAFDLEETRFSVGGCALLIPPGDVISFAEAIKTLIENPLKREILGRRARDRIAEGQNWDTARLNLLDAYGQVGQRGATRKTRPFGEFKPHVEAHCAWGAEGGGRVEGPDTGKRSL